jgi:hypothetical protein
MGGRAIAAAAAVAASEPIDSAGRAGGLIGASADVGSAMRGMETEGGADCDGG